MKNLFYSLLLLPLIAFAFSSCDKSFNPKTDYYEKYVLNCILCGDTSYQVASISHSYNVDGYDPYKNTTDPAVAGADLRLWCNDSVFVFRDSMVARTGNQYNDSLRIYYLDKFFPRSNQKIAIEAMMPNGRRLKSSTNTISEIIFDKANNSKVIPPVNTTLVYVHWYLDSLNETATYLPKLIVTYYKKANGENTKHTLELPVEYVYKNGENVRVYPELSGKTTVEFDPEAIKKALISISEGDPVKSNYSVLIITQFKIYALDKNLISYISANSSENDFTIRLDENDFTNIEGGFGVFGSYVIKIDTLKFQPFFITDLGYVPVY